MRKKRDPLSPSGGTTLFLELSVCVGGGIEGGALCLFILGCRESFPKGQAPTHSTVSSLSRALPVSVSAINIFSIWSFGARGTTSTSQSSDSWHCSKEGTSGGSDRRESAWLPIC